MASLSTSDKKNPISDQQFEERKKDHIRWALDNRTQALASSDFDSIRLKHCALPEVNFSEINLETRILKHRFSSPHFISSMTAGHSDAEKINFLLAAAAAKKNWLTCVGSQRRELNSDQASMEWSKIKNRFPELKIVSNIGIEEVVQVQPQQIERLIKSIDAIGLIVHLNPLQEIFQKEDALYKNSLKQLARLVKKIKVPVIVKEVGFGISADLARQFFAVGVAAIDVAGRGGSHWGMIEALRHKENSYLQESIHAFRDWGFSSVELLKSYKNLLLRNEVWASGGIRTGVDSAKCLALGAQAVGIAQPLMKAIVTELGQAQDSKLENSISLLELMDRIDFELKAALFCTGMSSVSELQKSAFSKKKVWYE